MSSTPSRAERALALVRIAVAATMFIHGVARLLGGGVVPFGGFLSSVGFPAGIAVAGVLTAVEVLASPLLAFGRWPRALSAWFAAQLATGILLVHGREGWFVVGAGRNGMEYSVLLITCLAAVFLGATPEAAGSSGPGARDRAPAP